MPNFPAFVIKIKINVTYFEWMKCQFSANFNFKSWRETGHKISKLLPSFPSSKNYLQAKEA
jgi:hypothetical protein